MSDRQEVEDALNEKDAQILELRRLVRYVLDKGDKPMWLSDGWREDARAALQETE